MEIQNFSISRHTAPVLRFRLVDAEDVTTWTTEFQVCKDTDSDTDTLLTVAGAITDPAKVPNSAALGVWDVPLTATNTALFVHGRNYYFWFKRTNSGYEDVLTRGTMTIF